MPSKKNTPRFDPAILALHNGIEKTGNPIVQALWFNDTQFLKGSQLFFEKQNKEKPLLIEYYCLFLAAVQRNEDQLIHDCVDWVRRDYPNEKLWIAAIEGQCGAWAQKDTDATSVLRESGVPFFQAVALRFEAVRRVKNRQDQLRQGADSAYLKAEQNTIIELLETAYEVLKDCSKFEACRSIHELAKAYPIERIQDKLTFSQKAIDLAKECGAARYIFTGTDRQNQIMRLQEASEFLDDQKSKFVGDVFRTLKEAKTVEEFAERTIDLLCRRSFLRIPAAAFVRRRGTGDEEKIIKQHPDGMDFASREMTALEVGFGYYLKVSAMTDSEGLTFFMRGLRYLFQSVAEKLKTLEPEAAARPELPYRIGGLELHDPVYGELNEAVEMMKMTSHSAVIAFLGETGTGKTEIAEALHRELYGNSRIFKTFNCTLFGSITKPSPIGEMDFFGAVKGTFTGQAGPKPSVFESVKDGTLFMDEVGDLPLEIQGEFLTMFERREYHKRGAERDFPVACRFIMATNRPIGKWAREWNEHDGRFREDLWERIDHKIHIPSLNQAPLQIPHVAKIFAEKMCREQRGIRGFEFDEDAKLLLIRTHWPGNLRTVEKVINRAVLIHRQTYRDSAEIEFTAPLITKALHVEKVELLKNKGVFPGAALLEPEEDNLATVLKRMAQAAATLPPDKLEAWFLDVAAKKGPRAGHHPEESVPPVPVAPLTKAVVPPVPPEPVRLEEGGSNAWKAEYVRLYRAVLQHIRQYYQPMARVIPAADAAYLLTVEKTGSIPRLENFQRIKRILSHPTLHQDRTLTPLIEALSDVYTNREAAPVPDIRQESWQSVGPNPVPAPAMAPEPQKEALRPELELVREWTGLVWELLAEFPHPKQNFFSDTTITALYKLRKKPYLIGMDIFLDTCQGFKNSPLAQTHGAWLDRLFEMALKYQGLTRPKSKRKPGNRR